MAGLCEGGNEPPGSLKANKNSIKHATMRVLLFQIIAPGIPLPPQPVLTRWGTWLDAVNYYAEHYGKIMEVIDALDSTDSSAVAAIKPLPSEQLLEDILSIDSNFKFVSKKNSCGTKFRHTGDADIQRIPNLTGEQSDGITVFRIPPMTSLMLHRCRTGAINLQRWWQSPSAAISDLIGSCIERELADE
ncbi:hypothetical protein ANN_12387 [Periplaneta americana]|uniref:Uncharacterized protein n=1 Tax=Periplaneta americana TaxID=6978 RepID=A0ABQ8TIC4_PERAM|nr:hypothetical protein ANN_12387 [Periplaneta americana]